MAAAPVVDKLSYSKVVATGGSDADPLTFARVAVAANSTRDIDVSKLKSIVPRHVLDDLRAGNGIETNASEGLRDTNLINAVKAISIGGSTPSLVNDNFGDATSSSQGISAETSPGDLFQRAESGSDMGTKPPSIDSKSIASGTTFALDEKESLRPDDSASVKAAAEDDDTFSTRESIVAGSRIGSEAAARAYRAQVDIIDRRAIFHNPEPLNQGIVTPQSSSSGQAATDIIITKSIGGTAGPEDAFDSFYKQTPDEKLLDALKSPKDRIFILLLEQDLISFVKGSQSPFLDLPPCNSFCRLLTHKLADYYHMTHQFDSGTSSVRIFRTPFCRLPPTLASISNPPTSTQTPPLPQPQMKIMRRGGDGDTGGTPSKATSEAGSDGKEKLSAKEKLSREEREAAYNEARKRIFGDQERVDDITPDTEDANDISRSSSTSARDRSAQGKRKPIKSRRDDLEAFDVRSQYTPYFAPPQQAAWGPMQQYTTMGPPQYGSTMTPNYPGGSVQPAFGQMQPQYYSPMMPGMGGQAYGQISQPPVMQNQGQQNTTTQTMMIQHQMPNMQPQMTQMSPMSGNSLIPNHAPQQFIPRNPPNYQAHSAPITAYGSPTQTPQQPSQWPQNGYQNSYPTRGSAQGTNTVPYAYGQLPSTVNPADPKSQHPIPGSFNRHAFNPKTQSFVPGNNIMQPQQAMSNQTPPHPSYNTFTTPPQFSNGLGYNMSRQGSNTSLPSYHASPHAAPRPIPYQPGVPTQGSNGTHHLPHFGNASTLPPKPPRAA